MKTFIAAASYKEALEGGRASSAPAQTTYSPPTPIPTSLAQSAPSSKHLQTTALPNEHERRYRIPILIHHSNVLIILVMIYGDGANIVPTRRSCLPQTSGKELTTVISTPIELDGVA
ncbi:hypothetical protein M407DRAFT_7576 [Tulasnella calospora MUT 4182]|uniref:Uncharacterized protein n=1 Tax=Tulasnella calospora MUT 4182 TaxID=1051891 RepID=A0A0C3LZT7_9AGAM|nr:hypothetical protein M407DRAFT_7576 [Tulasnella calospora MUT 4182]